MQQLIDKADILIEALPYIRRYYDKTIVVKYGGHAMMDKELKVSFARDMVLLKYIGIRLVIVHGGGPQIDTTLQAMGRTSRFIDGRRVTDDATMEVVEMVLAGSINQEIVGLLEQSGGRAIGLTGRDGHMLRVRRRLEGRDLGRVGEIVEVDPGPITAVAQAGFVPVVAPLGVDSEGITYNVNADEAAGAIARALRAEKLILLTDVEGVKDVGGQLVRRLTVAEARKLIDEGAATGGMIPKIQCCIGALGGGVARSHIIDGRLLHAVLLEIFTDFGVGTLISR
ncbi:MAG TPA: acetylglutamate kinase [Myxococcota bacterium]|nr:acetylglutamate kinase [Myxococcota bacterium]